MSKSNFYSNALQELQNSPVVIGEVKARYYTNLELRLTLKLGNPALAKFTILNLEVSRVLIKGSEEGSYYAVDTRREFDKLFEVLETISDRRLFAA